MSENMIKDLSFLAKHNPFQSLMAMAKVMGCDAGNIQAGVAGRRALNLTWTCGLLAQLGWAIHDSKLQMLPDVVTHLAVASNELHILEDILQRTEKKPVSWQAVVPASDLNVNPLLIARYQHNHVVVRLTDRYIPTDLLHIAVDNLPEYLELCSANTPRQRIDRFLKIERGTPSLLEIGRILIELGQSKVY